MSSGESGPWSEPGRLIHEAISRTAGLDKMMAAIASQSAQRLDIGSKLARAVQELNPEAFQPRALVSGLSEVARPWTDAYVIHGTAWSKIVDSFAKSTSPLRASLTFQIGSRLEALIAANYDGPLGPSSPWGIDLQQSLNRLNSRVGSQLDLSQVRLSAMELGYGQKLRGPADAFGRLDAAVRSSSALGEAVDDLVDSVRTPGALGFNQRRVENALDRVDDVLADPTIERIVAEPVEEVQDLVGIEEDVIRMPNVLGMVCRAKEFRLSTRGIFCGFTLGSLYFVAHAAYGAPLPTAGIEAFVVGANIYVITRSRTSSGGE